MKYLAKLLPLVMFALHVYAPPGLSTTREACYGEDNRREINDPQNPFHIRNIAGSVGIIVSRRILKPVSQHVGRIHLAAPTLEKKYRLCPGEAFSNQPAAGYCSGFLIKPQLFVTAGHCIKTPADCANTAIIFDFHNAAMPATSKVINTKSVFACQKIIAHNEDAKHGIDFAIIQLSHPASRPALRLNSDEKTSQEANLFVVGHPSGLPMKVAFNAKIRRNSDNGFFVTNSDTFMGNSGSPVINAATQLVEGISIRGEQDYIKTSTNCYKVKRCSDDGCRGEDATRSYFIAKALREFANKNNKL